MIRGDLLNFNVISCHGSSGRCGWQSDTTFVYKISSCQIVDSVDSKFNFCIVDLIKAGNEKYWADLFENKSILKCHFLPSANHPPNRHHVHQSASRRADQSVGQEDISQAIPVLNQYLSNCSHYSKLIKYLNSINRWSIGLATTSHRETIEWCVKSTSDSRRRCRVEITGLSTHSLIPASWCRPSWHDDQVHLSRTNSITRRDCPSYRKSNRMTAQKNHRQWVVPGRETDSQRLHV